MPCEVQSPSTSTLGTSQSIRKQGVVLCRRLPVESILVSSTSPRRNRKRNVSFSADLLLESAVRDGDLGEVRKLLNSLSQDALDRQCVTSGVTVLHQSALNCDADMTQLLINSGAAIESRDVDGWTPLQAAAAMGADACVKVLLDAGSDPYAKTLDSQESALDLVDVASGDQSSVRCVKYLVAAMQKNAPRDRLVMRMRDSIASVTSVSTCSSFGSNGSCPSPLFNTTSSLQRCHSQDSGIDSICSSDYRLGSAAPSPLCLHSETTRICSAIESLASIDGETQSSDSCDEFGNKGDSDCGDCNLQALDSDSDLDVDRRGSVMAKWSDSNSATSPMESQTDGSALGLPEGFTRADSRSLLTHDVDMVLNTGCVARRRRRQRPSLPAVFPTSGQQQDTPHRRLTFV